MIELGDEHFDDIVHPEREGFLDQRADCRITRRQCCHLVCEFIEARILPAIEARRKLASWRVEVTVIAKHGVMRVIDRPVMPP